MKKIIVAFMLSFVACFDTPLETAATSTTGQEIDPIFYCSALHVCREVGCPLPPGPFGGTGYLTCPLDSPHIDIPCFCQAPNYGHHSWCWLEEYQVEMPIELR